ncbi:hypothetical protein [Nocardia brasiliensis]|uniref:hypothetical protein n=1 Tax=Nocardia brasiliensis TaxID=37326 RepID=UPI0024548AFC|nr:hypothetical protein [Nocardia brasiliensis]
MTNVSMLLEVVQADDRAGAGWFVRAPAAQGHYPPDAGARERRGHGVDDGALVRGEVRAVGDVVGLDHHVDAFGAGERG